MNKLLPITVIVSLAFVFSACTPTANTPKDCSGSRLQGTHAARVVRPIGMWNKIPNSVFDKSDAGSLNQGDRVIMVPKVDPVCRNGVMWWYVEFGQIDTTYPYYRAEDGWVPESEGGGFWLEPEGQSVQAAVELKDYSWLLTTSLNIPDRTSGTIGETCNGETDVCLEGPASDIHYQRLIHENGFAEVYVCGLQADYAFIWKRVEELAAAGNIDNAANKVQPSVGCSLAVRFQGGSQTPDYEIWVTVSGGSVSYTVDPPPGLPHDAVYKPEKCDRCQGLYHDMFNQMSLSVVPADSNLWVEERLLNADSTIKNDGPIPGLTQGEMPQTGSFDEARVRYILADIELGGPFEYYATKNDPSSVEAVARWNRGVRVSNINQFQRKVVTIVGQDEILIVISGSEQIINANDVQLTQ